MASDKKISRKDFLAIIAGGATAMALSKVVGLKKATTAMASLKGAKGSYGNSPYGGKKA
jgi:hypothetical protein